MHEEESSVLEQSQPATPDALLRRQFTFFREEMVRATKDIAEISEQGTSNLLLGLGSAVLLISLFWKLQPFGLQLSSLQPAEFITVVLVALVLVIAGAYLRLWQFKREEGAASTIRKAGLEIVTRTLDAGLSIAKESEAKPSRRV